MALGIKFVETVQHRFPKQVLLMLFHARVMSQSPGLFSSVCLQNKFLFIALTTKIDELGLEERLFFQTSSHFMN